MLNNSKLQNVGHGDLPSGQSLGPKMQQPAIFDDSSPKTRAKYMYVKFHLLLR